MSVYYISNNGNDGNSGLSSELPIKTISHLNGIISEGDTALFNCGETFYGQIRPKRNCTYSNYGEGNNPVVSQYKYPYNDSFTKIGEKLWRVDLKDAQCYYGNVSECDVNAGFIVIDDIIYSHKIFDRVSYSKEYDFANDDRYFYIYCDELPENGISIACNISCVRFADGLKISNIDFRGTGGHGVCGTVNGAYISNCLFERIGGSELPGYPTPNTRYGNGVECWTDSSDVIVEDCYFADIYDVAITMQGNEVKHGWKNMLFRRNKFERCTQCFEIWSAGKLPDTGFVNCRFEENVCIDSGFGWGYDARPNKQCACHLLLYGLECPLCDIRVTNNTFKRARIAQIFKSGGPAEMPDDYIIENNRFTDFEDGQDLIYRNGCSDETYGLFAEKLVKNNSVSCRPMLFTNKTWDRNFAKDPAVVKYKGKYYLYFSCIPAQNKASLGVGIAVSYNMRDWEMAGELQHTQDCEMNGIGAPAAIVLDGKIHLFYQTYNNGAKDAICHAVSDDGVSFVKDDSNPVYHPSDDWCCGRAIDADVCVFENKLMMYIATRDHEFKRQMLGCASAPLNSDFSRGSWTQSVSASVLKPELDWEGDCIEAPAAITDRGKVYMFYGGNYNCHPQQIGCAVSENGVDFTRISDIPFMKPGKDGDFNSCESGHPYVFRDDDGKCYLYYQGSPDMGNNWYLSMCEIAFIDGKPVIVR